MSSDRMNRYWLPNLEINKRVITQELQYYLGPEAHVRPFTRDVSQQCPPYAHCSGVVLTGLQGEDGFLITTPGPCLTDVHPLPGRDIRRP